MLNGELEYLTDPGRPLRKFYRVIQKIQKLAIILLPISRFLISCYYLNLKKYLSVGPQKHSKFKFCQNQDLLYS